MKMKRKLEELVINPNYVVSTFCYSILRIEPYSVCPHACLYCYRRWVAEEREIITNHVKAFEKISKYLKDRTLPFRLSTLTDPFSHLEDKYKLSLKVLKISKKFRTPIIISTKSTRISKKPWIENLHENTIVQFTITTLKKDKIFEPHSPSACERFDAMEKVSSEGITTVLRLQPVIPGIVEEEAEEILRNAKECGAKLVIVENIRLAKNDEFLNFIGKNVKFEKYYESEHLISPVYEYRYKISENIKKIADKFGLEFSTCKEGFFNLHTAKNCCGIHFLESCLERITIKEILSVLNWDLGKIKDEENLKSVIEELLKTEKFIEKHLKNFPRPMSKKIKKHEKFLLKSIKSSFIENFIKFSANSFT